MSHFNLNNGMPRKRYIGPTHNLPCRPGTASLENLGGRIIIENEMHNHKLRLKQIKPSIDASKPWAHDYQDTKLRKMSPNRQGRDTTNTSGAGSPSSYSHSYGSGGNTSLPPASRSGAMRSQSRNGGGGAASSSSKASPSAAASSPSSGRGGFDVTSLSSDNQNVYKGLIQLLSTLPQKDAKALLEQAYREGEERKLLMAYTGDFPDAKKSRSSDGAADNTRHNITSTTAPRGAAESSAASRPQSSKSASRKGMDRSVASTSPASTPRDGAEAKGGDDTPHRSSMSNSRVSSAGPSRKSASTTKKSAAAEGGHDSFEKDDDE